MECVASGVFPAAAVLNHSCLPNCILRYRTVKYGSESQQQLVEIVAITDIGIGISSSHLLLVFSTLTVMFGCFTASSFVLYAQRKV